MTQHKGHCRCGGVAICINAELDFTVYCHCDDCRRSAGAPVIASMGVRHNAITWEAEATVSRYVKGTCTRSFCNVCGTPIAQEHESASDYIFFNTAFMEEPEKFPPTYHSFAGQQLSWLELTDNLPRYEKTKVIKRD